VEASRARKHHTHTPAAPWPPPALVYFARWHWHVGITLQNSFNSFGCCEYDYALKFHANDRIPNPK
jgi:hypothetical protein